MLAQEGVGNPPYTARRSAGRATANDGLYRRCWRAGALRAGAPLGRSRETCQPAPTISILAAGTAPIMPSLETKIPPPIVLIVVLASVWTASRFGWVDSPPDWGNWVAAVVLVAAVGFGVAGTRELLRADTTTDSAHPDRASSLVTCGVYRLTRNPIYLAMALILTALGLHRAYVWGLMAPVAFVLYVTRFQILPEERAMAQKFGAAYAEYRARVRRWI